MTDFELTKEDRQCLQFWFRQALAEVERREVCSQLLRQDSELDEDSTHHNEVRRPIHRSGKTLHQKDLVSV